MTLFNDDDVQRAIAELIADGGSPGSSLHSWRCEYPDRYGPCRCLAETARDVLDAVLPGYTARIRAEWEQRVQEWFNDGEPGQLWDYLADECEAKQ